MAFGTQDLCASPRVPRGRTEPGRYDYLKPMTRRAHGRTAIVLTTLARAAHPPAGHARLRISQRRDQQVVVERGCLGNECRSRVHKTVQTKRPATESAFKRTSLRRSRRLREPCKVCVALSFVRSRFFGSLRGFHATTLIGRKACGPTPLSEGDLSNAL